MLQRNCVPQADSRSQAPFPQKYVDFYQVQSADVPAALLEARMPLPNGAGFSCVAADGAVWIGNDDGLTRVCRERCFRDEVQYFNAPRWLPDNHVLALIPDGGSGVWVRTTSGAAHIYSREMTFEEKSAVYDARVPLRQSRHGFVADAHFKREGDYSDVSLYTSDNDGLWTAMYAAGACYEYVVTGSQNALDRALSATNAVLSLVDVTGIKGYFARSFVTREEGLPGDGFWLPTADGKLLWKSDTSSDELVGHNLIYLLAYELLPDEAVRSHILRAATEICDYIIANDYYLIDVTGKPTMWGNWNTDYFNGRGYSDTSLNAAELLSFLKVTAHITGEERFAKEYRKVAFDLGYADLCCTYLERKEETINYSDEELCYLTYLPLVLLETDEELRSKYRAGMSQWWQNISREANPLWTYIYKLAAPDAECDLDGCLWTLRRIPLDLRHLNPAMSDRHDLVISPELGRFDEKQIENLLAPDERRVSKWNANIFDLTDSGSALSEEPGTIFTLPYWLGRYYGFIK